MTISLVNVGAKITAALLNSIIGAVNAQGSTAIVPTVTGTGVAVGTDGLVTFTSTSVVTVDTVFSSTYRKTKISVQSVNNSGTATMIFRTTAPADDTSAKYDLTSNLARNATVASSTNASGASWTLNAAGTTALLDMEIEFVGAATAAPTTGFARIGAHSNPAVQNATDVAAFLYLTQQESVAFGGFKITFGAACSGTIRITGEA